MTLTDEELSSVRYLWRTESGDLASPERGRTCFGAVVSMAGGHSGAFTAIHWGMSWSISIGTDESGYPAWAKWLEIPFPERWLQTLANGDESVFEYGVTLVAALARATPERVAVARDAWAEERYDEARRILLGEES